jgi:hypothetical protein
MSNGKGNYKWLHSQGNLKLFELAFGWKIRYKLAAYTHMPARRLPDLCDDSVELVIHCERFGKAWKHHVRNAQQNLKRGGL